MKLQKISKTIPKYLFYGSKKSNGIRIYNIAETVNGSLSGNFVIHETKEGVNILFAKILPGAFSSMSKFIHKIMNKSKKKEMAEISSSIFNKASKTSQRIESIGLKNTKQKNLAFLKSEIKEFEQAIANRDKSNMEEELGDILFDTIMLADSHGINPQEALDKTISKLNTRMNLMETFSKSSTAPYSEQEALRLWQIAKKFQKNL